MAASDPQGQMQFWKDGQPFGGVENGTHDAGQMQFWLNGQPMPWIFPTSTPPEPPAVVSTGRPTLLMMGVG